MVVGEFRAYPQHICVGNAFIGAGFCANLEPLRPFHLDRGDREKKGAWEVSGRAKSGLRDGLFGGEVGKGFSQRGGGVLRRQVIDGPGNSGFQAVGGKASNRFDAGFAAREFGPIIGFARAKRSHHAKSGDDHNRPPHLVLTRCHRFSPQPVRSTRARPSPRQ